MIQLIPQNIYYLIALKICNKEWTRRFFFYKLILQRFCDEKQTDNKQNKKNNVCHRVID